MKFKQLLTFVAACALAIPSFAKAEEDTPMTKEMEKISKALKAVNRSLDDATQKAANLEKIAIAKAAVVESVKFEPAKTKDIPAAEKAKFVSDFKASMEEVSKNLDALKAAIEGGKTDEAKALMEKLTGQKKEGHKKFKTED